MAMLLHDSFDAAIARWPDKKALILGSTSFTYGALGRMVGSLARFLQDRGVKRGDRVATFLSNGLEAVVGMYAALRVGAVFMPLNPLTKLNKLRYMLEDATPVCLITERSLQAVWGPAVSEVSGLSTVIVAGGAPPGERQAANRFEPPGERQGVTCFEFDQVLGVAAGPLQESGLIDQDLAAILYTSGSTGEPKGVMLTHLNMVSARESVSSYLGLRHDDIIFCALPLSFDYGLYQILMAFNLGACVVLERSFAYPVQALEIMQRERVTVFPGVPTMFAMLMALDCLDDFDLGALRIITNTAAALPERHIVELRDRFPRARLFSMYGLTECKRVTFLPPEELDRRPMSVGKGMPNEEVYLVDEEGRRLPPGSTGELVIRGSHVMRGYWRKPEATARRLKPGDIPGELVLYSGDIFRTDSEGFLYFVARKDDIIKSRGEKVSPREVENVLCAHPGVLEAAAVGIPDPVLGEAIVAFVALRPGSALAEHDILRHCKAHLEAYMVPTRVHILEELPRTGTGKVDKLSLKRLVLEARKEKASA